MKQVITSFLVVVTVSLQGVDTGLETRSSIFNALPFGNTAKVNNIFDIVITRINYYLLKHDCDPYYLQDHYIVNITFVDALHITWRTRLALFAGEVRNLTSLRRAGDATVHYNNSAGAFELRGQVVFGTIQARYSFAAEALNVGPRGTVHANVTDLSAQFVLHVFPLSFTAKLKEFGLNDATKIKVNVRGVGLLNSPASIVANEFTRIFKGNVLKAIEKKVREEAAEATVSFKPKELTNK